MNSYRQIYYHLVFGTKNRENSIPEEHCTLLYKYIWGIIKKKGCNLYRINGMQEHIHIFTDLHPSICLADFIKDIKVSSSFWLKNHDNFPKWNGWANGSGSFTCSHKEKDSVISYIKGQKEHHKKVSFIEEYEGLLNEYGIPWIFRMILTPVPGILTPL
ncbi:IS200/IS605 family transposase [Echinicola jeungdonensis]|uniref:IS200/IS605 family transposase n=1 Tax=Echinicola jeungdonensis TaxID=709343 RepID=A0ABV5J1W7_9BACT|nr:IS200/IS605 family transposase [Echinicola jeungdonensis]MDN3667857.1 IS200/IS605 family transposase [Echinicola jeungdonensis]